MKKFGLGLLGLACVFTLGACGNNTEEGTLRIGATSVPHAEILEEAKPLLEKEGITLEVTVFSDYVMPNVSLTKGDLDANFFQHIPYLNSYNADNDTDIVSAGGIHIEPIGVYSKDYKSLSELPDGATIIMSSSVADHGRMLSLLQEEGLIKIDSSIDSTTATVEDIVENPKNIVFKADVDAGLLVQLYNANEGDAVLINTNFALDGGLNPMNDAIALEGSKSPYVNIIAVNNGDEDREDIQKLVEVLHSEDIQNFIIEKYEGAVVPVSE